MGCLVSITVTCTFLKSNRFLLVGVFLFRGIGAARLTQRLPVPAASDAPDSSLDSAASCSQSLLVVQLPSLPRSRAEPLPPPSHSLPRRGGRATATSETSVSPGMEIPPSGGTGSLLQIPPGAASPSGPGRRARGALLHILSCWIVPSPALEFFFLLTSQG